MFSKLVSASRAVFLLVAAACAESTDPGALVVDRVELSATTVAIGPNLTQTLIATARAANGAIVPGRTVDWISSDDAIVTVTDAGEIRGIAFGSGTITATVDGKSATANVAVIPTQAAHLAGTWRMTSFDGLTVPAPYVILLNEPVGDKIVARVEIRLDSAKKTLTTAGLYQRFYYFTELHDDVVVIKYGWGDHGTFTLGANVPVAVTLTSEYIQNVFTPGQVTSDGRLSLSEELWLSEPRRATIWSRGS
jgi:hypothetical protein